MTTTDTTKQEGTQAKRSAARGTRRRTVIGKVTSDKMQKSLVVTEERRERHPLYGKVVRRFTNYKVHDEKGEAHLGDTVEIVETRPISRTKCWRLVRIVSRAREGAES